jgi:hypothetical protein
MQTHISEQTDEIAWVRSLYPQARDYLDTYEAHGLLGANGLYGHAIHLEPREIDRLAEVGAALVHCPTSNTFIGSGLFDMSLRSRLRVGLATDTGGGSSFSMLRTMAAAYEIAQLRGTALHPSDLLWLRHRRVGRRVGPGPLHRAALTGVRGRPGGHRPGLHTGHRTSPCAGRGYLAGALSHHHDGRRPRHRRHLCRRARRGRLSRLHPGKKLRGGRRRGQRPHPEGRAEGGA